MKNLKIYLHITPQHLFRHQLGKLIISFMSALIFVAGLTINANAADFTVTNLNDSGAGSLRQAILDAGAAAGDDAIVFQSGLTGTISLTGGELLINSNLTITGPGINQLTVTRDSGAATNFRIFNVAAGAFASITGIKITGGRLDAPDNGTANGGGILNNGNLILTNVEVSGNSIAPAAGATRTTVSGGGIHNAATLTLLNCVIKDNSVTGHYASTGGGITNLSSLTATDSSISGNTVLSNNTGPTSANQCGCGGGIHNGGSATMTGISVSNNTTTGRYGRGGGINSGGIPFGGATLNLTNSTVTGNAAQSGSADDAEGGGIRALGNVTITDVSITENALNTLSHGNGGGLYIGPGGINASRLVISGNQILAQTGANGGGFYFFTFGSANNLTVSGNHATSTNGTSSGGGIYVSSTASTIGYSTISGNTAHAANGSSNGGGVGGAITLSNSTVAGNTASNDGGGSVVGGGAAGTVTLRRSTIAENHAIGTSASTSIKGGGVGANANGMDISNSIIAKNTVSGGTSPTMAGPDVNGVADSDGTNIIGDTTSSSGWVASDILNQDPLLGPLGNYGGFTQTYALNPNSPAINAAQTIIQTTTDQRGAPRFIGAASDIGSFENNITISPAILPPSIAGQPYSQTLTAQRFLSLSEGTLLESKQDLLNQTAPFTFTLIDGSLPSGLTLSPSGVISGMPTSSGTPTFTVKATDADGMASIRTYINVFTCNYSIDPNVHNLPNNGGTGSTQVTTVSPCPWTAQSNDSWITVISGSPGSGSGALQFSVQPNPGGARTGTITVAGLTITINQAGACPTSLTPPNATATPSGGSGSFNVTAPSCSWTAETNNSWISITSGGSGTGNGTVSYSVQPNPGAMRTGTIVAGGQTFTITQQTAVKSPYDFDGDGRTDIGIWRASTGSWWYLNSSDLSGHGFSFGLPDDIITPGDFTGDGKTDLAIWRPSTGEWFVQRSEDGSYFSYQFGLPGDIPAPADYDGDGITDTATFRPSTATWYIFQSATGTFGIVTFGLNGDRPVPADYDGDGKADIMVWRPSNGTWWIVKSSNLEQRGYGFGQSTDKPVPGDYTGDGKADIAVWRNSTREWFFLRSEDGSYYSYPSGLPGDIPAPGDYDGDGKFDSGVFRPSTQTWYIDGSTAGSMIATFGLNGDRPVPNAFVP